MSRAIFQLSLDYVTKIDGLTASIYNLPGCNLFFNSHCGNKGGLLFILKFSIKYEVIDNLKIRSDSIESLFINVSTQNDSLIMGNIYRRPGSNFEDFLGKFEDVLRFIGNKKCLIGGDLNLNFIDHNISSCVKSFIDLFFIFSYIFLINKPTRESTHSATLIDHIWTNYNNLNIFSGILVTDASDNFSPLAVISFLEEIFADTEDFF